MDRAIPKARRVAQVGAVAAPVAVTPHWVLVVVPHGRRELLKRLDGHRGSEPFALEHLVNELVAPVARRRRLLRVCRAEAAAVPLLLYSGGVAGPSLGRVVIERRWGFCMRCRNWWGSLSFLG